MLRMMLADACVLGTQRVRASHKVSNKQQRPLLLFA
jgi:hypothetical protein